MTVLADTLARVSAILEGTDYGGNVVTGGRLRVVDSADSFLEAQCTNAPYPCYMEIANIWDTQEPDNVSGNYAYGNVTVSIFVKFANKPHDYHGLLSAIDQVKHSIIRGLQDPLNYNDGWVNAAFSASLDRELDEDGNDSYILDVTVVLTIREDMGSEDT